jgi:predicted NBD/HSP70 family sugar kinase
VLGIFFGTGVGAALIEDGQVFRGDRLGAGNWSHADAHGDAEPLMA